MPHQISWNGMLQRRKKASPVVRSGTTSATSTPITSPYLSAVPTRVSSPAPEDEDEELAESLGKLRMAQPFRFFELPAEIRLRVYEEILHVTKPLDLDPTNYRLLRPNLTVFLVSHRMHEEAYRVFYSQPLRLFPMHGRFFHSQKPLLARLPARYRAAVNNMELRLGPGWSKPPLNQNTQNAALGLYDCTTMRTLKIFVEIDPSDGVFNGFRGRHANEETYKKFCVDLLGGILEQVPSLETVEIDAYPSVKRDAPLVMALVRTVGEWKKILAWGPLRGWDKDNDEPGLIGLEGAMAGMELGGAPRVVEVQA